jgi:hypothetical protein
MCHEAIHASPDLQEEWVGVRNVNGDEMFWAGSGRYAIKATNDKAGRGTSNDEVNIDELRTQTNWKAWSSLSKTTMAVPNSQLWAMSNAGDDTAEVLTQLRAAALAGADASICIMEWSGADNCEIDDWEQIAQANPGMGYTVQADAIATAMATDPPGVFRTEVLCQFVQNLDEAISGAGWKACADPTATLDGYRDRIAVGFDISPDERHCTLVAAAKLPDGRVRVEAVRAWTSTDAAFDELPGLLDRIKPVATAWFPVGPGAAFATLLRPLGGSAEMKGAAVAEACQGLADAVRGGRVLHSDDPLINAHVTGAQKLPSGDGWRFTRRGGSGHVDGAYATAGAVFAALTMPERQVPSIRVISY